MASVPILLRRVLVPNMPDDDWSASQVPPSSGLTTTEGVREFGCFYVARAADESVVNPSGSCDLQPVLVAANLPLPGHPPEVLVWSGATDTDVVSGQGLTYEAIPQSSSFTLRVVDGSSLDVAVAAIDIYWYAIA